MAESEATTSIGEGILSRVFSSCAADPRGSVHRLWGISLLFVVLYFVVAVFEMMNMKSNDGSFAVLIASIWSGLVHLGLGVLGTFVLKRFPTSFSVGFLLGVMIVIANQNLLLFATFLKFGQGDKKTNALFAVVGFCVFGVMSFMSLLLFHFKQDVVVAQMDSGKESNRDVA
mmetsp:Transcript_18325/g.45397  ORF Transcript_18325/g.45397 Transcript_18325/m.45397 type:complete len:172 (-) Transcript_18325:970-1485(-)